MNTTMFENVESTELEKIDGGFPIAGAALIGCGVIFLVSAGINTFNGYQDAKRK